MVEGSSSDSGLASSCGLLLACSFCSCELVLGEDHRCPTRPPMELRDLLVCTEDQETYAQEGVMFELPQGWLFYGLDGGLYVARHDITWHGWEVFEVRIEWWASVYNEDE